MEKADKEYESAHGDEDEERILQGLEEEKSDDGQEQVEDAGD